MALNLLILITCKKLWTLNELYLEQHNTHTCALSQSKTLTVAHLNGKTVWWLNPTSGNYVKYGLL